MQDQVGKIGAMDTPPAEPLPPPTLDADGNPVCCGEGSWGEEGKPLVLGCQMCRKSASNWRRAKD